MAALLEKMGRLLRGGPAGKTAAGQQETADAASGADGQDESSFNEDTALKFVQDRWNDLKNAYIVLHQSVWETLLFYANQTWIEWEDSRKVWQPAQPSDEWVPMPRINRFSPTVDAVASNMYQVPEVEAVPTEGLLDDPAANSVAWVATQLARHALSENGFRSQIGTMEDRAGLAAQLFVLTGSIFSVIRVDKADPVEVKSPLSDPSTGQQPIASMPQFKISCDIENVIAFFPRPGAQSINDSPYLLVAKRRPLDEIWFRWDFEAQADAIWPDGYSVTYEHALNFWYTGYSSSTVQIKDSCMVLEMYVAPSKVKDMPGGFYLASANDRSMYTEPWQFPEHPVTMACYLKLPTIFFGRSIGFDLCEIQRELNAYESMIKLHAMTSAVDPVVVDASTIVSEITGRADKVIKWRSVGPNSEPPHRMGAGHMDDGVYKQRDNLHAEFQNISMAVNAVRGQQEGAITAASAIQQLRSQAELMFNKPVQNWSNFWKETVRKIVVFYKKYYPMQQIVAIVGQDHLADVEYFMKADLDTSLEWVASQHGLPKTRDERRQEMMTLWDKGALDMNNPAVRQKIYELFGETGMMETFNKDATNARLENAAMKNGQRVAVMPVIEDLAVHLFFHKDCAKSQDFKKWPQRAQELLIMHIAETQNDLQQQQMQAQQMAAGGGAKQPPKGTPGGAPPKPGAGGPQGTQAQVNGAQGAVAAQGATGGGQ